MGFAVVPFSESHENDDKVFPIITYHYSKENDILLEEGDAKMKKKQFDKFSNFEMYELCIEFTKVHETIIYFNDLSFHFMKSLFGKLFLFIELDYSCDISRLLYSGSSGSVIITHLNYIPILGKG